MEAKCFEEMDGGIKEIRLHWPELQEAEEQHMQSMTSLSTLDVCVCAVCDHPRAAVGNCMCTRLCALLVFFFFLHVLKPIWGCPTKPHVKHELNWWAGLHNEVFMRVERNQITATLYCSVGQLGSVLLLFKTIHAGLLMHLLVIKCDCLNKTGLHN